MQALEYINLQQTSSVLPRIRLRSACSQVRNTTEWDYTVVEPGPFVNVSETGANGTVVNRSVQTFVNVTKQDSATITSGRIYDTYTIPTAEESGARSA